jgi:hypothetical protein
VETEPQQQAQIISLAEYRRGWRAARALWMAGFNPSIEDLELEEDGNESFFLGWNGYLRSVTHGQR